MKYLISQIIVCLVAVTLMSYLSSLNFFYPIDDSGEVNWYHVSYILFLIFLFIQGVVSLTIYLVQKFTAYGRREFPAKGFSLKWGLGIALIVTLLLILNIFHLLSLPWGIMIAILIALVIAYIR